MRNNLLIICDEFPPCFAPRMGCLARYLSDWGWTVRVLTACTCHYEPIYEIPNLNVPVVRITANDTDYELRSLPKVLRCLIHYHGEMQGVFLKMLEAGKQLCSAHNFDVLLASQSNRAYALDVANRLSCIKHIPVVADFRDIHEQYPEQRSRYSRNLKTSLWRSLQIRRRNKLLSSAVTCTCATPEYRDILSRVNPDTHVIFNGYDEEVFKNEHQEPRGRFELVVGGSVSLGEDYPGPQMLFETIAKLQHDRVIVLQNFVVSLFVGKHIGRQLLLIAKQCGVDGFVQLNEPIKTCYFAKRISKASVLVLFGSPATHGVMPTKMFEYLGVARPILVLPCDRGSMATAIAAGNAGCSAKSVDEACCFLRQKYYEWKSTGRVESTTDFGYASQFTRRAQAHQFRNVLNQAIARTC